MPFNRGYLAAIKPSATGGGVFKLLHVDGGEGSPPGRGIAPRGSTVGVGQLALYHPSLEVDFDGELPPPMIYPLDCKFDANGIAVIAFNYDHAVTPHTVSGPAGILATNLRWQAKGAGCSEVVRQGQLLHFINLTDTSSASPHFSTPTVPIPRVQEAIDKITERARQLAAAVNSMSRPCMAGVVIAG